MRAWLGTCPLSLGAQRFGGNEMNKIRRAQLGFAALVLAGGLASAVAAGQASAARNAAVGPARDAARRRSPPTQPRQRRTRRGQRQDGFQEARGRASERGRCDEDAVDSDQGRQRSEGGFQRTDPDLRRHRSGRGPGDGRRLEGEGRDDAERAKPAIATKITVEAKDKK